MRLVILLLCLLFSVLPLSIGQNNVAAYTYLNLSDCVALYARSVYLVNVGDSKENISLKSTAKLDLQNSNCGDLTRLIFSYSDSAISLLRVGLNFVEKRGFWSLANASIDLTCTGTSKACVDVIGGSLQLPLADTPSGWGYTCSDLPSAVIYPNRTATRVALKFFGLQLQVFNVSGGIFGNDTVDCTGYFSIPVWSTLIVSFLLITILTYGLSMLTSIQPNEKYDDPKAKAVVLGADN